MADEMIPNERARIAVIPQMCVCDNLRRASRIVSGYYDEMLRSTGLHANQIVLLLPPYLLGPISISKMAERTGLDRTTLTRNLRPLEARGVITIAPGDDLRTRIVKLTAAGREVLVAAVPLWEAAQKEVIELLGFQHSEFMNTLATLSALNINP